MLLIFLLIIIGGIGASSYVIGVSIQRGIVELQNTLASDTINRRARRILAWNLIEPGITVPNAIVIMVINKKLPMGAFVIDDWPQIVMMLWPMLMMFLIVPLIQLIVYPASEPHVHRAIGRSVALGMLRIVMTLLAFLSFGWGAVAGIPILFWSINEIERWTKQLSHNPNAPHKQHVTPKHKPVQVKVLIGDSSEWPR